MDALRKAFYPMLAIVGAVLLWTAWLSADARQCLRSGGAVFRDGCAVRLEKHFVRVKTSGKQD